MGALTLKSFPFELRGWDIEKFESIDPTDGFGSKTRIYVSKDRIVQIEPDYDVLTFNTWLTDKGRQFFDGIFGKWDKNKNFSKVHSLNKKSWFNTFKSIILTIYLFDHCNKNLHESKFFTIVFENLSTEILSMLLIISQNYSFLKVRRAENIKLNNDLESNFQLNLITNKIKLSSSDLCILISTNPRYEGYLLNLNLRQRFLKGNFRCLTLGSDLDLTFPVSFLGSNVRTLKSIAEGNNIICQDIRTAKNPFFVLNSEILKRNDGKALLNMVNTLKYSNIITKTWVGINTLNPSLAETGTVLTYNFMPVNYKDLADFSSLYFLNVTNHNMGNLKKIADSKLLNFFSSSDKNINKFFIDQSSNVNNDNSNFFKTIQLRNSSLKKYYPMPTSMFYENNETFLNTEGIIRRTNKAIFRKKTKNSWQVLRKFLSSMKHRVIFLNNKDSNAIYFNSKKLEEFRNFINFNYYASQSLTNLNFYIATRNKPFVINNNTMIFKVRTSKLQNTKLKYWLDDFFNGSKDEYSQNSLILSNCSSVIRKETSNFF